MPLLQESGVVLKIVKPIVLQYEPTTECKHISLKNEVGKGVQSRHLKGRVSEYKVVLHHRAFDKFEHIGVHYFYKLQNIKRFGGLLHELYAARKFVNIGYVFAPTGNKLIAMTACATEKVQHFEVFKIKAML